MPLPMAYWVMEKIPEFSLSVLPTSSPYLNKLECGPMPNVMVALANIGGALCSMPQSLADAPY